MNNRLTGGQRRLRRYGGARPLSHLRLDCQPDEGRPAIDDPIYDDGRYLVSSSMVATPSRIYPVANTTAGIRRDPLWTGLGIAAFVLAGIATYGDLLYPVELLTMVAVACGGLFAGWQVLVLRLDAPGHRRALIVGPRKRIWKMFRAIRSVRVGQTAAPILLIKEE